MSRLGKIQPYCTGPCFVFVGVGDTVTTTVTTTPAPDGGSRYDINGRPITPARPRVDIETSIRSGNKPTLLGIAEYGPKVHLRPRYHTFATDSSDHDDIGFLDEDAMVFADLNVWSEAVYSKIARRPFYKSGARGTSYIDSRGTLLCREGHTYPIWLWFPYSGKNVTNRITPLQFSASSAVQGLAGFLTGGVATALNSALSVFKDQPGGYRFLSAYLLGPDVLDPLGSRARKVSLAWHAVRERPRANTNNTDRRLYDHSMDALVGYDFTR